MKVNEKDENLLREDFIQYLKDVLTKTSSSSVIAGAKKLRTEKINQRQNVDDIISIMKKGVIGKRGAVEDLEVPDINKSVL